MSKRDETLTGWIRDTVDRGATSAEEIHKSIANLPLDMLERNGLFEQTAAEVRKIQDQTLGAVYDLIRDVNERVSELTSDLLPGRPSDEA